MTDKELENLRIGDIVVDNRKYWEGVEGKVVRITRDWVKFEVIKVNERVSYPKLNTTQSFEVKHFKKNYNLKRKIKNNIKKL